MEHAFAKKGATQGKAVKAANERTVFPDFYRVANSSIEQLTIYLSDRCGNPGLVPIGSGMGAAVQNAGEVCVVSYLENVFLQQFA